jgi:phosphopentomutase
MFQRAIVIVLDGVGIGELPDAAQYGDQDSDTLGHIASRAPLDIPTLRAFGLGQIAKLGGSAQATKATGAAGRMAEASVGKDSVTGHWEIYALPPAGETLLDHLAAASMAVVAIGKIEDLFAGRGIGVAVHTASDDEGMDQVNGT